MIYFLAGKPDEIKGKAVGGENSTVTKHFSSTPHFLLRDNKAFFIAFLGLSMLSSTVISVEEMEHESNALFFIYEHGIFF